MVLRFSSARIALLSGVSIVSLLVAAPSMAQAVGGGNFPNATTDIDGLNTGSPLFGGAGTPNLVQASEAGLNNIRMVGLGAYNYSGIIQNGPGVVNVIVQSGDHTWSGNNSFGLVGSGGVGTRGVTINGGTVTAASNSALGGGDVRVNAGGTLRLTSNATVAGFFDGQGGTLNLGTGNTLTINGGTGTNNIFGAMAVTGSGTIVFNGTAGVSGLLASIDNANVSIDMRNNTSLSLGAGTATRRLNSLTHGAANLLMADGTILELNNGGALTGTGSVSTGTLQVNAGTLTINGTTMTHNVDLGGGSTLRLTGNSAIGSILNAGGNGINLNGFTLTLQSNTNFQNTLNPLAPTMGGTLRAAAGTNLTLSAGANTGTNVNFDFRGATLTLGTDRTLQLLTTDNASTLATGGNILSLNGTGNVTLLGTVTGGGQINVAAGGLTLNGTNLGTTRVNVANGTSLTLQANQTVGNLQAVAGSTTNTGGNTLTVGNGSLIGGSLAGGGTIALAAGAVVDYGPTAPGTTAVNYSGATLRLVSDQTVGNWTANGASTLNLNARTLTVNRDLSLLGTVQHGGATGNIALTGGRTLTLNGNNLNATAVNVAGGALVTGAANTTGNLTNNGGVVALDVGQTLTVGNYVGSGALRFAVNTAGGLGRLNATTAVLNAGTTVALFPVAGGYAAGQNFDVITTTGGITGAGIPTGSVTAGGVQFNWTLVGGTLRATTAAAATSTGAGGITTPLAAAVTGATQNQNELIRVITTTAGNASEIGQLFGNLQLLDNNEASRRSIETLSGDGAVEVAHVMAEGSAAFAAGAYGRLASLNATNAALTNTAGFAGVDIASATSDPSVLAQMIGANPALYGGRGV